MDLDAVVLASVEREAGNEDIPDPDPPIPDPPDPDLPNPEFGVMLSQQLPGVSGDSNYGSWAFFRCLGLRLMCWICWSFPCDVPQGPSLVSDEPFLFVSLSGWFAASRGHLVLAVLYGDCCEPGGGGGGTRVLTSFLREFNLSLVRSSELL